MCQQTHKPTNHATVTDKKNIIKKHTVYAINQNKKQPKEKAKRLKRRKNTKKLKEVPVRKKRTVQKCEVSCRQL
jgi:hypothetical protein